MGTAGFDIGLVEEKMAEKLECRKKESGENPLKIMTLIRWRINVKNEEYIIIIIIERFWRKLWRYSELIS